MGQPTIQVEAFRSGRETMSCRADDVAAALTIIDVQLDEEPTSSIYVTFGEVDDDGTFVPYLDGKVLQVKAARGVHAATVAA